MTPFGSRIQGVLCFRDLNTKMWKIKMSGWRSKSVRQHYLLTPQGAAVAATLPAELSGTRRLRPGVVRRLSRLQLLLLRLVLGAARTAQPNTCTHTQSVYWGKKTKAINNPPPPPPPLKVKETSVG